MDLDPVTLSRAQFALTVMFHYLFPPLSIGLGAILVLLEGTYLKTRDRRYEAAARFFTKLFAVNFAVGVATGIVMEFQFGTNWSTYSRFVGDVFGSALAAEGIFAFFLESGFLAVLVFGWDRVGPKMHFFSTLMVFLGSTFSAVWIVIANSWQQTPAGFHLVGEGAAMRAEITDFWAMIFNPSSMHRLNHVILGSLVQGAFFVMSIAAFYLLKKRHEDFAKRSFTVALVMGAVASVAILISGHAQANAVAVNQPAKLAAFEGHFETGEGGAPLYLFGWPDAEAQEVKAGVAIPGGLSFLIHGDFDTPVDGLDTIPDDEEPPVAVPFVTYHLMVALGMFFIGVTLLGLFLRWRGTLWEKRWLLKVFVVAVIAPYVANQTGWVAAEVGRQPWVVYGLLRTEDAVSPSVPGEHILTSIVLFSLIYLALGALWLVVMNHKIQHGPEDPDDLPPDGGDGESQLEVAADVRDRASHHRLAEGDEPEGAGA
ncbi:MAG: cytochrome ubiquinol oxidase subunit I [Sandaracinus sp.]|nr:cytochrome ubiquinol oxidase subunit I [Sandaracinus sp.]